MKDSEFYTEHVGKVVEAGQRFEHVMAISLDPRTNYKEGIVRCILAREGNVSIGGYIDRSELYSITGNSLENFKIGEKITIENKSKIVNKLIGEGGDFLGFEDPDIWIDETTNLMHVYFTMPTKVKDQKGYSINLGHAVGKDIHSLVMTEPSLLDMGHGSAKEVSISPINSKCIRYNLIESSQKSHTENKHVTYSTVRIAIAKDMGAPWEFGETIFNPENYNISWIAEHASPGPFFPKSFIDIGKNKILGILNGRESSQRVDGKIKYNSFSIGLFIYDYEYGKIDWISPEPLIIDSEAKSITFASQFIETSKNNGILYAHVDDSFVWAYSINALKLNELLP